MAYGDNVDPKNRVVAIVLVGLLTAVLGYGLVNGLNISIVKKIAEKLDVADAEEPPPPEKPPPPPPPDNKLPPPPPVVTPPSPIPPPSTANQIQSVPTPPPAPPPQVYTPPAPPAPPATPDMSKPASPKGSPSRWVTNDDYPPSAQRQEREGTTGFRLTIGPDGKATGCTVTSSSGHSDLDDTACKLMVRRSKFNPAVDRNGNPTAGSWASRFTWKIDR